MNEKVTKRWVDCLNSMRFALNVKKNLDLLIIGGKNINTMKTQKDETAKKVNQKKTKNLTIMDYSMYFKQKTVVK